MTRATLDCELPSGRKVTLRELTGEDELACAADAGDELNPVSNLRGTWSAVMRSLVSLDGNPFQQSHNTAESTRALFSSKDWRCVSEAHMALHAPRKEDIDSFRRTFKFSTEEPVDGAGVSG